LLAKEALINAWFLVCFWFFRYKKTMSGKKEEMAECFGGKSVCGFLLPPPVRVKGQASPAGLMFV
jgi:hypothetical protein